jgi:Rad3-related DNA helicase
MLSEKGVRFRFVTITSKEKICILEKPECNPGSCPRAKGHLDRVNDAVFDMLTSEETITRELIEQYAKKHNVCPFEMCLDVSTWADAVICDYNYVFDPTVSLKRFFADEKKRDFIFLIDEAHNLYERTKEMYTVTIEESKLIELQSSLRRVKAIGLKRALKKLILYINDNSNDVEEHKIIENDFDPTFYSLIEKLNNAMLEVSKNNADIIENEFLEVSRMLNRFKKIHDYLDDNFVTYIQKENDSITYYIRCIDSSSLIKDSLDQVRGAVLFSATMTPMDYYIKTLGGNDDTPYLKLPSPFDKKNLCLLVRSDISTRYKDRANSYLEVAKSIKEVVSAKTGNYLVFFSSFQYLESVLSAYDVKDEEIIVQSKEMNISSREEFLSHFIENPNKTTVGFAVLGGVFSEGIDLVSDRLIGAVIVGVGLPMVSFERDLIKDYFDKKGLDGFDYAYTNPGKNKVMQAAGRVIRSKDDKGVVLLIDQRFMQPNYRDLFKLEWSHYQRVFNTSQIKGHLFRFWDENK